MKKSILKGCYSLSLFIALTILLLTFDRATAGHTLHVVGLSSLNKFVFQLCGSHKLFDTISDLLLLASILFPVFFGCIGLKELITRKSYLKVDRTLRFFIYFFLLACSCYFLFDKLSLNVRPVFDKLGQLDPSYPSSHVMFSAFLCATGVTMMDALLKKNGCTETIRKISYFIPALCALCRVLSGNHWFTDVLAGLLLGYSLAFFHRAVTLYQK